MSNHLDPKPSEVMERNNFYKAHQEQGESVAEFAARLKKLATNCNFPDLKNSLRDQLVCELRDHETKVNLFKTESLTYDTTLKEAVARETALTNASNASATDRKNSQKVFAIESSSRSNTWHYSNNRNHRGKPHGNPVTTRQQQSDERQFNGKLCWNCGGRGHTRDKCPSPT